eukprot:g1806.t1
MSLILHYTDAVRPALKGKGRRNTIQKGGRTIVQEQEEQRSTSEKSMETNPIASELSKEQDLLKDSDSDEVYFSANEDDEAASSEISRETDLLDTFSSDVASTTILHADDYTSKICPFLNIHEIARMKEVGTQTSGTFSDKITECHLQHWLQEILANPLSYDSIPDAIKYKGKAALINEQSFGEIITGATELRGDWESWLCHLTRHWNNLGTRSVAIENGVHVIGDAGMVTQFMSTMLQQ